MRWILALVFVVIASSASAQTIDTICGGPITNANIVGCMDSVNGAWVWSGPSVPYDASEPTAIGGWTVSLFTRQQPSDLRVYYSDGIYGGASFHLLPRDAYDLHMRIERPDVTAEVNSWTRRPQGGLRSNLTTHYWGYLLVIKAGALPPGGTVLALVHTDPALQPKFSTAVNIQQVTLRPR